MKLKKFLFGTIFFLIICEAFFLAFSPIVKGNGVNIPIKYSQDINLNGIYVYNITTFGTSFDWYNSTWGSEGTVISNSGEQIYVNFTGFYDRDPNDSGDYCDFPDINMPWMDIKILNYTSSGLEETFKVENKSNSEVASNLVLNFNRFNSGFLVPLNFTWLNATAQASADSGGADLTIEETYHFIQFDFIQPSIQRTILTYDKKTGLLIYGNTSLFGGYALEINSLNFTISYNSTYNYDIIDFGEDAKWYNFLGEDEGSFGTNPAGLIQINFTGNYNKDINDWANIIDNPIPWMNISIFKNNSGILLNNFTLYNRSNSEVALRLVLGYNGFQSGFLISVENLTSVEELALQQKDGYFKGNVSILETPLTFKIKYNQYPSGQKTQLIYEKLTGLLLWGNTSVGNYHLELVVSGYIPWKEDFQSTQGSSIPPSDNPIIYLPYLVVILVALAIGIPLELIPKFNAKTKKIMFIMMIGISSFSGLIFFNNNMNAFISGNQGNTLKEKVVDITLTVDFDNGTILTWENFTLNNYKITVYDALNKWCDVELESTSLGYIVKGIDGIHLSWVYDMTDKNGTPIYGLDVTKEVLDDGYTINFHIM